MKSSSFRIVIVAAVAWILPAASMAQQPNTLPIPSHGKSVKRLVIKNTTVIDGGGAPAFGPVDLLIENGLIVRIARVNSQDWHPDAVIDATGKYVMPGIINTHVHWHEEREPGIPQPVQYERNLYLASGVTTTREVGGNLAKSQQWQAESKANSIVAPRMYVDVMIRGDNGLPRPEDARAIVRQAKKDGADGIKIHTLNWSQAEAVLDESKKMGLPVAAHIGVEDATAKDFIDHGVRSIEHFYGIGEAAIDGDQDFPPEMNYFNELHRFARAGELYTQANPEKLKAVVEHMAAAGVFWSPTMVCYIANRDALRAQNQPWFKDYLHPSMEQYWKPDLNHHMSYLFGWSHTLEVQWNRDYRIWMDALVHFARSGGLVTVGDDAGWNYNLYGFGTIRELELQEEAGFHPLEVIKHATANGAKLLGMSDHMGYVRPGYMADVLVVNGNPLENLSVLNPYGVDVMMLNGKPLPFDGSQYNPLDPGLKSVHGGGIEWTIKDGIPYYVPTLMSEVKEMVSKARAGLQSRTSTR